jgi:Concanavalin A-like lectin/glucanases superfamily/PEP-CTERM motif
VKAKAMQVVTSVRRLAIAEIRPIAKFHRLAGTLIVLTVVGWGTAMAEAGAIAHWSFDEIVNTNQFADSTGNYDATISDGSDLSQVSLDTTTQVFGAGAAAFQRTGTAANGAPGAYARLPAISGILDSSFTVASWVKLTADSTWSAVLGDWSNDGSGTSYLFGISGDNQGAIHAINGAPGSFGGFQAGQTTPLNPVGDWFHVAWVFDRNSDGSEATLTKYINGSQATQHTWSPGVANGVDLVNSGNAEVWIGLKEDNGFDFEGSLDELWVVDSALSKDQIGVLMDTNAVVPEPASILLAAAGLGLLLITRSKRGRG